MSNLSRGVRRTPVVGDTVSVGDRSGLFSVVTVHPPPISTVDIAVLDGLRERTGHVVKGVEWNDLRYED